MEQASIDDDGDATSYEEPRASRARPTPQILLMPDVAVVHGRARRTVCVDNAATFSTDMNRFARRSEALHRYDSVMNCALRAPYHIAVFLWELAIAAIYRTLRVSVAVTHRSQMPGDEDAEYQLEYVASVARRARPRCLLIAVVLVALSVAYVVVDALYLHRHGLAIDVRPPTMSAATLLARATLRGSDLLALYANGNESEQSLPLAANFTARERIEQQTACDWRTVVARSTDYLQANRGIEHCCCAPMFGIDFNHLALEMHQQRTNESMTSLERVVVHFFNVVDLERAAYDALTPAAIARGALGRLVVVEQSQAHLFAWPPADAPSVRILRRHTLALRAMNWAGAPLDLNVSAEQAYCVAECVDLFAGVSVYERARRQAAAGVKL